MRNYANEESGAEPELVLVLVVAGVSAYVSLVNDRWAADPWPCSCRSGGTGRACAATRPMAPQQQNGTKWCQPCKGPRNRPPGCCRRTRPRRRGDLARSAGSLRARGPRRMRRRAGRWPPRVPAGHHATTCTSWRQHGHAVTRGVEPGNVPKTPAASKRRGRGRRRRGRRAQRR